MMFHSWEIFLDVILKMSVFLETLGFSRKEKISDKYKIIE